MRLSLLRVAVLCAAPLAAACDLSTGPNTPLEQLTVSGFAGKGIFADSVGLATCTGSQCMPFRVLAPDSSGQASGELLMFGDTIPPAGTYDLDGGHLPQGFSTLVVDFILARAGGGYELYQPYGGNMVITSVAGDSIAGTLGFSVMYLAATCTSPQLPLNCQQVIGVNKQLTLGGSFLVRRSPAGTFPGS